ncbi:MAG: type IV pili twitching motility protein PilT, partial [Pseudomonadota bacterium]|nr:type IV pili twitching motility protein PilT [Pseudomonadota bacterium]
MSQISFEDCLKILVEEEGSDLYYSTGAPPSAKFFGTMKKLSEIPMLPGEIEDLANTIMNADQIEQFSHTPE